jgi:hypothetical protein
MTKFAFCSTCYFLFYDIRAAFASRERTPARPDPASTAGPVMPVAISLHMAAPVCQASPAQIARYTVKNGLQFPVPSRDVTNQTLPDRE